MRKFVFFSLFHKNPQLIYIYGRRKPSSEDTLKVAAKLNTPVIIVSMRGLAKCEHIRQEEPDF